ncbi:hypothetical protein [Geminisphaera colitermitum]|uniref:hypothetical protein n=1 Tax=Geminisphaera colitermitum TaxID=1148786 RepID=UPI0005BCE943|nr:hypothetical protein [Geminisphaera colitermitum]
MNELTSDPASAPNNVSKNNKSILTRRPLTASQADRIKSPPKNPSTSNALAINPPCTTQYSPPPPPPLA